MKALSDQLTDLAARSKKTEDVVTEDVVTAAREKNRAKLEGQRDTLKASIADGNAKARRAGKDIKTAEHHAEQAEQDAADAID
jgi:hypothetical protein